MLQKLKKHIGPQPDRAFVKYRMVGKIGEILYHPQIDSAPLLSVIIPTRDAWGKGYFPFLLKQLQRQSLWDQTELFVVKSDHRQGRAINSGAALAKGKYLLTLDDDVQLSDSFAFEKLIGATEENPTIGMVGGTNVIPHDATDIIRRIMTELPRRLSPPVHKIVDSDLAEHPLLLMRKDVFLKIGGENELIPRGLDPYLRQEFRKAGFRVVVVPGAKYSHLPPSTLPKLIKQFFNNGKQAAFCNIFYPQWVIETPDHHGEFDPQILFSDRIIRYFMELLKAILGRKWILLFSKIAYAAGFIIEVIFYRRVKE